MRNLKWPSFQFAPADTTLPACPSADDPGVEVWRNPDGSVWAYNCVAGGEHWIHLPGRASFRFQVGSADETAVHVLRSRPNGETAADLRHVRPYVLAALGIEVLHAGGVLGPRGVVGFVGHSMVGKSTIVYGLNRRGYSVWADDLVAFRVVNGETMSFPLPFDVYLRPASAAFYGAQAGFVRWSTESNGSPNGPCEPAPIAALCVLRRAQGPSQDRPVEVARMSSALALSALLEHGFYFSLRDAGRNKCMMESYLGLISGVPVYEVRIRPGFSRLPGVLDGLEGLLQGEVPASS